MCGGYAKVRIMPVSLLNRENWFSKKASTHFNFVYLYISWSIVFLRFSNSIIFHRNILCCYFLFSFVLILYIFADFHFGFMKYCRYRWRNIMIIFCLFVCLLAFGYTVAIFFVHTHSRTHTLTNSNFFSSSFQFINMYDYGLPSFYIFWLWLSLNCFEGLRVEDEWTKQMQHINKLRDRLVNVIQVFFFILFKSQR